MTRSCAQDKTCLSRPERPGRHHGRRPTKQTSELETISCCSAWLDGILAIKIIKGIRDSFVKSNFLLKSFATISLRIVLIFALQLLSQPQCLFGREATEQLLLFCGKLLMAIVSKKLRRP